jgi:hypothetical protein
MTDFDAKEKKALESIEKLKQPIEIPEQLRRPEFGFVLLAPRDKKPTEKDWTNIIRRFDNPILLEHIQKWGNYGVRCGVGGLIVLDGDTLEVQEKAETLPKTFTVKTSKGKHYYFICPEFNKKVVLYHPTEKDEKGNQQHMGEIQSVGTQVVGPSSVHPSGIRYNIINNMPITTITKDEIISAFNEYLEEKTLSQYTIKVDGAKINIEKIRNWKELGFKRTSDGWQGAHPIHGSETGQNLHINIQKDQWYCHRCQSGGGPYELIVVLEGIISCKDAKKGALRGNLWHKVVEEVAKKYSLTPDGSIQKKTNLDGVLTLIRSKFGENNGKT